MKHNFLGRVDGRVMTVVCRLSLSVVVSGFGCRVSVVDCSCRLSLSSSLVGAQL
jgi:hypothetical protein